MSYNGHDATRAGSAKTSIPRHFKRDTEENLRTGLMEKGDHVPHRENFLEGDIWIEKHRPIMLTEACRKVRTDILIKRVRRVWDANGVSTTEPIMKPRVCIDQAVRRNKALFLNGEDLSKVSDLLGGTMKGIALRRLWVPPNVVDFLASLYSGDEVHIITAYGVTYDTPGFEKGFEAQCEVKQGAPEGPFVCGWLSTIWPGRR